MTFFDKQYSCILSDRTGRSKYITGQQAFNQLATTGLVSPTTIILIKINFITDYFWARQHWFGMSGQYWPHGVVFSLPNDDEMESIFQSIVYY